jgi:hypothetical protein
MHIGNELFVRSVYLGNFPGQILIAHLPGNFPGRQIWQYIREKLRKVLTTIGDFEKYIIENIKIIFIKYKLAI